MSAAFTHFPRYHSIPPQSRRDEDMRFTATLSSRASTHAVLRRALLLRSRHRCSRYSDVGQCPSQCHTRLPRAGCRLQGTTSCRCTGGCCNKAPRSKTTTSERQHYARLKNRSHTHRDTHTVHTTRPLPLVHCTATRSSPLVAYPLRLYVCSSVPTAACRTCLSCRGCTSRASHNSPYCSDRPPYTTSTTTSHTSLSRCLSTRVRDAGGG